MSNFDATETFNAAVNIFAVEYLIKTKNKYEYERRIEQLHRLNEEGLERLNLAITISMTITNLGEMIIQDNYNFQKAEILDFLDKEVGQVLVGNLAGLQQYKVDRDIFCGLFNKYGNLHELLWDFMPNYATESFNLFQNGDEFYIFHLPSGTMINWYKHLGRTNTCNKDLTLDEYDQFIKMLYEELLYVKEK